MAKTGSISIQMKKLLDEYSAEVREVVEQNAERVAKNCANELKITSPKRPKGGKYARSWTADEKKGAWIVHNSKHYQLTHLLENGHVSANQYGSGYRRVPAIKHIAPVEQQGIDDFLTGIEQGLR